MKRDWSYDSPVISKANLAPGLCISDAGVAAVLLHPVGLRHGENHGSGLQPAGGRQKMRGPQGKIGVAIPHRHCHNK